MSVKCVELACVDCKKEVVLPLVEGRPGYVSIKPLTDWTAPPLRCPKCSGGLLPTQQGASNG